MFKKLLKWGAISFVVIGIIGLIAVALETPEDTFNRELRSNDFLALEALVKKHPDLTIDGKNATVIIEEKKHDIFIAEQEAKIAKRKAEAQAQAEAEEEKRKAQAEAEEEKRNRPISVTDLMVDYGTYKGNNVRVKGFLIAGGGMLNILYTQPGAISGVFLNFDSLDRESHKKALQHCSAGCTNVVIEGYVTDVNYNKGLKVTAIKDK